MRRVLLLAVLLAGCETHQSVSQKWVGHSESELLSSWGAPSSVYRSGDATYLTYVKSGAVVMPSTPATYTTTFSGRTAFTTASGGSDAMSIPYQCGTTFTVRGGTVTAGSVRGC